MLQGFMRLRRSLPALAAALLVVGGCGAGGSVGQLAGAERALSAGSYREAEILLRNAIKDDGGNARAHLLLARALYLQGDHEAAMHALQESAERGADAAAVTRERALLLLERGDYASLLADMDADGAGLADDERRYFRARALQGLLRMAEALPIYEELLVRRPDSPDLYLRIAQCHFHHGRRQLAEAALQKAIELPPPAGEKPVTADVWMLRAAIAQRSGDSEALRVAISNAVRAAPGQLSVPRHAQLLLTVIEDAVRRGDSSAGFEAYAELVKLKPQDPLTAVSGARLHLIGEKPAEAVAAMQLLSQKMPEYLPARLILAAGLLRTGSLELASREIGELSAGAAAGTLPREVQQRVHEAADAPAGSVERALSIASALIEMQQPVAAKAVVNEALATDPEEPRLNLVLAQLELAAGQQAAALARASELRERMPDSPAVIAVLADAYMAGGQYAAAEEAYARMWALQPGAAAAVGRYRARSAGGLPQPRQPLEQWLARSPGDIAVRMTLAMALQAAGEHQAAMTEYQRVVQAAQADSAVRAVALNNLAWYYHERSDRRALDTARAAYEAAPGQPAIADTYGWLLLKAGRSAEALPLLREAATRSPESAEIRYHYAAALAAAGETELARIELRDLLLQPVQFAGREEAETLAGRLL